MSAIGIIGEDETDCKTIRVLLQRLLPREIGIKGRYPPKGGCAAMRRAAPAYMEDLQRQGCSAVVIVHDLDLNPNNQMLNDEQKLRAALHALSFPSDIVPHICIPVEELEAWFWADQNVLDLIGKDQGKAHRSPHAIRKPKEELMRLSRKAHHKAAYSTNENPKLAEALDLEICAACCPAFRELRTFVLSQFVSNTT